MLRVNEPLVRICADPSVDVLWVHNDRYIDWSQDFCWQYWESSAHFYRPNEVGARLCFYTCVWFCSQGVSASVHAGIPTSLARQTAQARKSPPPGKADPHWQGDTHLHSACWEIRSTSRRYASYWTCYSCVSCGEPYELNYKWWIYRIYMLWALLTKRKEWKENNYYLLFKEQIWIFICTDFSLNGQKRSPLFYILLLKVEIVYFLLCLFPVYYFIIVSNLLITVLGIFLYIYLFTIVQHWRTWILFVGPRVNTRDSIPRFMYTRVPDESGGGG